MSVLKLHKPRDADPLQDIIVQHTVLILLSLIVVLPVVSGVVFLQIGPSLVPLDSARAFSSSAVAFRFTMVVAVEEGKEEEKEDAAAAVGRGRRSERRQESTRSVQIGSMT